MVVDHFLPELLYRIARCLIDRELAKLHFSQSAHQGVFYKTLLIELVASPLIVLIDILRIIRTVRRICSARHTARRLAHRTTLWKLRLQTDRSGYKAEQKTSSHKFPLSA